MLRRESLAPNPDIDRALLARIEDAGLNASAPPQQRWLDGWLVRFCPGKAKRARCINAVSEGIRPIAEKLEQCDRLFDAAGLPLIVRITPFTLPDGFDSQIEALGLRRFDETKVIMLPDISVISRPILDAPYAVRSVALEPFAQRVGAMRGSSLAQRQAHAQRLVTSPVPFFAFEIRDDTEVVACGQFSLEGDLVGLYDIFTAPRARRRNLASQLCRHMLAQAAAQGAKHAYLQVDSQNTAARSVYSRLGFSDGYGYYYRARDPAIA